MFVVVLANNFDPFFLWDIDIECANSVVPSHILRVLLTNMVKWCNSGIIINN